VEAYPPPRKSGSKLPQSKRFAKFARDNFPLHKLVACLT
jgi:hypothetical protein